MSAMQRIPIIKKNLPSQAIEGLEDCRELPHTYLLVGQGGIFTTPTLVQTVLGSCVSVTMYCSKSRWGGIFHALLPKMGDFPGRRVKGDHFRYVDSSILYLLREFSRAGIAATSLECKVFGGASPLHQHCDASAGLRNVQAAIDTLTEEGISVIASSVGGNAGRKLFFRTDTGLVLQKRFQVSSCKECDV
jgi:chemotaxis protein CheD